MRVILRNPRRELEVEGPKRVKALLRELGIHPDTVLVIRGEELLTGEDVLGPSDEVEIRPVISGGGGGPPVCRRCRQAKAVVELRRHNAAFCRDCFLHFFREQVRRAVEGEQMIRAGERVLVAVSGGKDSLALWDVLAGLGYDTTGYHIVLWTGQEYAAQSLERCRAFAAARGLPLEVTDLRADLGFAVPELPKLTGRPTCSACGLVKRHLISKTAAEGGFDVVATGHNLDDEAAALLGNVLRWEVEYLARQSPVLQAEAGFVRKVKPLYRLSERETAAYAFLRRIDYVVEECPLVAGNTQLRYKQALDVLEASSPGTKAAFLLGFLERGRRALAAAPPPQLRACTRCGMPTPAEVCAFCRMTELVRGGVRREAG